MVTLGGINAGDQGGEPGVWHQAHLDVPQGREEVAGACVPKC